MKEVTRALWSGGRQPNSKAYAAFSFWALIPKGRIRPPRKGHRAAMNFFASWSPPPISIPACRCNGLGGGSIRQHCRLSRRPRGFRHIIRSVNANALRRIQRTSQPGYASADIWSIDSWQPTQLSRLTWTYLNFS